MKTNVDYGSLDIYRKEFRYEVWMYTPATL